MLQWARENFNAVNCQIAKPTLSHFTSEGRHKTKRAKRKVSLENQEKVEVNNTSQESWTHERGILLPNSI